MACPIASIAAVVASVDGARALLVQDPRYRALAWVALAVMAGGWWVYFAVARVLPLRVALESFTVIALLGAVLRVRWLMRRHGLRPPLLALLSRWARRAWDRVGSPWLLAAKVWLAAMLIMEWRGKAQFAAIEYALLGLAIVTLAAVRWRMHPPASARFAGLESLAVGGPAAACPFGFGRDSGAAAEAGSVVPAGFAASRGDDAYATSIRSPEGA